MRPKVLAICIFVSVLTGCNYINLLPQMQTNAPEAVANQVIQEPLARGGTLRGGQRDKLKGDQRKQTARRKASVLSKAGSKTTDSIDYENIWARMRAGYKLDFTLNPRIQTHLNWYSRHQLYLNRVAKRARRYLYYIVTELEAQGLPLELALLPVVESAFDPFAYSHGRASGMWQIIPETGVRFDLKQNWWYDGRRDIKASTRAALEYLSYLNDYFQGDWLLALAAYNTGEGNVQKAILKNQRNGKPTDFWSLKLPMETRAYVPQLLALATIVRNPAAYNLALRNIPNRPYFLIVDVDYQIDLAQAAEMAGINIEELYLLNPGYNRWATDPKSSRNLLLPVNKAAVFAGKLSSLPRKQRVGWEHYKVKTGDSLLIIAQHFNTSVSSLKKTNDLTDDTIEVGQMLLIPVATQPAKHYAYSADQRMRRSKSRLHTTQQHRGATRINYRVKAGDTFWEIAQQHGVKARDIARWNGMAPRDSLREGQTLVVWSRMSPELFDLDSEGEDETPITRKVVAYQVRQGDSLAGIAGKFNLSINDIMRWNTINNIHPGQSLTLFVDVTQVN